jgi:hypothetical protein
MPDPCEGSRQSSPNPWQGMGICLVGEVLPASRGQWFDPYLAKTKTRGGDGGRTRKTQTGPTGTNEQWEDGQMPCWWRADNVSVSRVRFPG